VKVPPCLTSAWDGRECSASRFCRFVSRNPSDVRLGGPQSQSEHCGEEKNLTPIANRTSAVLPVARHYTDWAIGALEMQWNSFCSHCDRRMCSVIVWLCAVVEECSWKLCVLHHPLSLCAHSRSSSRSDRGLTLHYPARGACFFRVILPRLIPQRDQSYQNVFRIGTGHSPWKSRRSHYFVIVSILLLLVP
jgi:hypothetical protein